MPEKGKQFQHTEDGHPILMTPEERALLIKELTARLPYGVKTSKGCGILELSPRTDVIYIVDNGHIPYLRPMSSMTEEEKKTARSFFDYSGCSDLDENIKYIDWLNENHFDYRGLIPMGLASEAPEGMYR